MNSPAGSTNFVNLKKPLRRMPRLKEGAKVEIHRCERGAIVSMKRMWKPLDVGGFRLYEVTAQYISRPMVEKQRFIVPAKSPSDAARLITEMYTRAGQGEMWDVFGKALNVYVPESWWTNGVLCPACEAKEVARAIEDADAEAQRRAEEAKRT
jgi:hypothetical protein